MFKTARLKPGLASNQIQDATMKMKQINSGRLRAIVYDARARMLQYGGIGEDNFK
ncbi:MAG TPA: hypothetical protein VIM35_04655 [Gallionella sp.]